MGLRAGGIAFAFALGVTACSAHPHSAPRPVASATVASSARAALPAAPEQIAAPDSPSADSTPSAPQIPGLVVFPERGDEPGNASIRCGDFTVERRDHDGLVGHVTVRDGANRVAFEAKPHNGLDSYEPRYCLDLDGDGQTELVLTRSTGGAHCCHTEIVVSLGPHVTELLRYDAGNAGGLQPRHLDGQVAFQLVSRDDSLTEIDDLPYAFTPQLPVVFALVKGRFARRTPNYPTFLKAEREAQFAELAACGGDAMCEIGTSEAIAGMSLLIGDWQLARSRLGIPIDALRKVDSAAKKLRQILSRRGERLPQ